MTYEEAKQKCEEYKTHCPCIALLNKSKHDAGEPANYDYFPYGQPILRGAVIIARLDSLTGWHITTE